MAPTITELDLMVQSFYDGRGEQVSLLSIRFVQFFADVFICEDVDS